MKQRKFLTLFAALFFVMMPAVAVFTGMDLDATLSNLRRELYHDYLLISETREQMGSKYEVQHQKMVSIVKRCNDLSLMLYSQKQDYTFDVSYALERVMQEYDEFNANRTPYDRIVSSLDVEINRYARLIESLRRLPPELRDVEVVPDSLAYHNDTLDAHLMANESLLQQELNAQLDSLLAVAVVSAEHPSAFILSEAGQADRDSCLLYASELLKLYAETRELVMTDSTHYREAQLRMAESYNYARDYSALLQDKVFKEGQTPWKTILAHPGEYWKEAWRAMAEKYNFSSFMKKLAEKEQIDRNGEIAKDNQLTNSARIYWLFVYCLAFFVLWGLSYLLLLPLYRYVKPLGNQVAKEQKLFLALLLACVLFITLSNESMQDDIARKSISITHTFIWLLLAINTALLVRLDPVKLKYSVRIYLPTIFTALVVISCRVLFMPNAFLNVILTPLLLAMALWQLLVNLRHSGKTDKTDVAIAWASFGVTAISLIIACRGFIFLALIVLAWWYFQLALILAIASIWDLTQLYKKKRLDRRISTQKAKITYVAGATKDNLMFGATWFYDLIREVAIPLLVIGSIPICVYWALNIFEFNDLYRALFQEPFYTQGGFQASIYSLLFLGAVFVVFRYANKAIHALWQTFKYRRFMRKNNRKTVRGNEINLALGNSLISVFVWFVYADLFIVTLNIPTDSLGLVAGGLSAGVGLALKDILNNFIYGIQLMGGRLRVGDWIDCDGIRGKVVDINYQTTLVETLFGTQVAFLNASLFGKNFTNLTRNNAYELTIIKVGVAYGTDFQKVREALEKGLEVLKTKDKFGRDIVEPTYGHYIRFDDFGDSSVNVAVRQYVLVSEQIEYRYQCKELIYKILAENNITIPFPQRDVHMIDEKK
jgi:small-conductance mechanosensitive channel